ncbi:MAG TPA: EAL domain-containing protein [Amycolatopsis sp.]|nr:EAL domain-containing protein [Amycolatopsis sp.]
MGIEVSETGRLLAGTNLGSDLVTTLALSESAGSGWRLNTSDGSALWTPGIAELLDAPGAGDEEIGSRLRDAVKPLLDDSTTSPQRHEFELVHRFDKPGGGARWTHFRARRFRSGQAEGLIGVATDVTGQAESRLALADLTDRYRLLVDLSPDGIIVHQAGRLVYVNPATLRFVAARSAADLIGRSIVEFMDPSSIPALKQRIRSLTEPGATSAPAEAVLRRLDGDTMTVESVSVRTTWEGEPAFQVIMRDITAQRTAEAALRYQAALVLHVSDAIIATDEELVVTSFNPAAESIFGISAEEAVGRSIVDLTDEPLSMDDATRAGGVTLTTHRLYDKDVRHLRISAARMDTGYVLVGADETARRRAEQYFTTVVASLEEGVVVFTKEGVIETANPATSRILDLPPHLIVGERPSAFDFYDETGGRLPTTRYPMTITRLTGSPQNSTVVRVKRRDKRDVWLSVSCRPLSTDDGPPYPVVASLSDTTERRVIGERLLYEATHDPLTGLANRSLVVRRLADALRSADREGSITVLFVDLDKFKVINDSLGHSVGDEVLRVVGKRLRRAVRRADLVGRLGGDEFAVIDFAVRDPRDVETLAVRLRERLVAPINLTGRELHIDASIGIVVADRGDARTADDLIRDADVAMYQAKTNGPGRFEFFDVALREQLQRRLRLEQDLRRAVLNEELWVAYQPVVDLGTASTVGMEALLRWNQPVLGVISPVEFIPLAEESDLINKIGIQTLRTTTRDMARRRQEQGDDLHVAVNLSARQLDDPDLLVTVEHALHSADLPAEALCLEITETTLMRNPADAAVKLQALRSLGVTLAIDDFGTGYASLAQLLRLPLDVLKIDRSFVVDLGRSREAEGVVGGIIAMAHAIGLTVIAEGVETAQQAKILRRLACDRAQGYYYGRPESTKSWLPPAA